MKIAVLIPCLNEEKSVSRVVSDFRRQLPEAVIYVFDNGSTDQTVSEAKNAGAVIQHVRKRGKGNVVIKMFQAVRADFFVMVDGDSTYPAESVKDLLKPVMNGECDMSVGRRIPQKGLSPFPKFHKMGNFIISKIINWFFKSKINDVFSGYRVFNSKLIESLPLLSCGFEIETELTLQALDKGFNVKEVEVPYKSRPAGSFSKLKTYGDGFLVIKTILSIIKDYKPLAFFSLLAIFSLLGSLGFGSFIIREYIKTQHVFHPSTAVLATGLMLLSLLFFSTGLILDSVKRHYSEQYTLLLGQISRLKDFKENSFAQNHGKSRKKLNLL